MQLFMRPWQGIQEEASSDKIDPELQLVHKFRAEHIEQLLIDELHKRQRLDER